MEDKFLLNKINFILFSLIPLSIIIGASVSLINVILICFFFIISFSFHKNLGSIFDKSVIALFIIFIYLLFNSLISVDYSIGIYRNFGFVRFIILFLAINYLFYKIDGKHIFTSWLIFLCIVLFDCYIELIFGTNLLGYGEEYRNRLVSFFKDEPIVASYFNGFILIIFGFFLNNFKNYNHTEKILFSFLILLFLICILFTGERSNTIKIILGFFILFYFIDFIKLKIKLSLTFVLIFLLGTIFYNSNYLKNRFGGQLFSQLFDNETRASFIKNNVYFNNYSSGIEVFKSYPLIGVGNKNYRIVTCEKEKKKIDKLICNTHPHQVYIEFLSEHGLLGTIILISLFFYLMFKNLRVILISKNYIQIGALIYLVISFIPVLPSGSFFNNFNSTLFFINLSLLYAINKDTNIFHCNLKKN